MSERRYGDAEVREILSLATTSDTTDQSLPAESGGLTLDDLQRIAQEVGIEPARIAHAAMTLDSRGRQAPVRRSLGMPIGVSRVVDLPRAPTDREWEQLIAEFRTTFATQGRSTTSGGLRDWSHGNLHISVEPTARGEQLRLSTLKDGAVALNGIGFFSIGMSVFMSAMAAVGGKPEKALPVFGLLSGLSLLAFGANVLRLPRWARERERQMEMLAAHAVKLLSTPPR